MKLVIKEHVDGKACKEISFSREVRAHLNITTSCCMIVENVCQRSQMCFLVERVMLSRNANYMIS